MAGGIHGRGHAWQGGHAGDVRGRGRAWRGLCVTGETATAADGTHPTGMHSCLLDKIIMTYFSSSDAEMFSKLYRTFASSRFLRDRIQNVAAVKRDGLCTRSKNFHQGPAAPKQQQPKFVNCASRRSLKCSVGVLFLQRQFMRNLCLVQTKSNKDSPQSNSTDSASLKLEQTQCGLSAILSGFKGYAHTVDVNQNVPCQNARTRFKNLCNSRHYHSNAMTTNPVLSLPGSSSFTRSANNIVNVITADVGASTSYRRHDVPVRCYSTSPETEPKPTEGGRDETQERPEKIPLKVANSLRCICAFKFFFLLQNRSYGLFTLPDADSDSDSDLKLNG